MCSNLNDSQKNYERNKPDKKIFKEKGREVAFNYIYNTQNVKAQILKLNSEQCSGLVMKCLGFYSSSNSNCPSLN